MIESILLSLTLAGITSISLVFVGILLVYIIEFAKPLTRLIIKVFVNIPLVLPPTVLGFYFLILYSPKSWVGSFFEDIGLGLSFSFGGLVIASIVFSLPFMVNPLISAIESLPDSIREVGRSFNRPNKYVFLRMQLPLARHGLISGALMAFAHTLGEFGLVLMIGGNIPGKTRVASVEIYNRVISMDYAGAHYISLSMIILSILILGTVFFFQQQRRQLQPW